MRLLSSSATFKARQKNVVVSPSNRHFHVAQVQLQHLCHRYFNSHQQPAAREYILTTPETQMPSIQVIQHTQQSQVASKGQQQQSGEQPISFIVVDDQQQAEPSRQLTFSLTLTKHFNPPSVSSGTGEESQHNISGLSSFSRNLQSLVSYQQIDKPQPFLPVDTPAPTASPPITTASQQAHRQPAAQPPHPLQSANAKQ